MASKNAGRVPATMVEMEGMTTDSGSLASSIGQPASALTSDDAALSTAQHSEQALAMPFATVGPPSNYRSKWWEHYTIVDIRKHSNMKNMACCRHCGKTCSLKNGRSGMASHMNAKHPELLVPDNAITEAKKRKFLDLVSAKPKKSALEKTEDIL
ncbi:MAG: zinc finger BED domain-containing protein [bacterium]